MHSESFGIIGGDIRQTALAGSILKDGNAVYACGFDKAELVAGVKKADADETINKCDNIILPLPVTNDGKYLKMDLTNEKILLNDDFALKLQGKRVFGGMTEKLKKTSRFWNTVNIYDYFKIEEFEVENAVPTAEGAIETAMREFEGTIHGSRCLVAGFGRIGKTLAYMLSGIGADVTVSARKRSDLAWIKTYGYKPVLTYGICKTGQYDIIFNTIPALVFDKILLERINKNTLIIDLASSPGGVDLKSARKAGIKIITALSLPGKVAPKTAGEIIKNVIYNIISDNGEGHPV